MDVPRIVVQLDGINEVRALVKQLDAQLAAVDKTLNELSGAVSLMELRISQPSGKADG